MTSKKTPSPLSEVFQSFRRRGLKFAAVSIISTIVSQSALFFFITISSNLNRRELGWIAANIAAVIVGTVPSFILSKKWVWEKNDRTRFFSQVAPFFMISFVGLIFSTLLVGLASIFFSTPIVANLANLVGYGILWVFRFTILDRFIFSGSTPEKQDSHKPTSLQMENHPTKK